MPRAACILDPGNPAPVNGQVSIPQLPLSAITLGRVPDVTRCLPGDLILSQHTRPSRTSRIVSRMQSHVGFQEDHRQWTHAAIFLYDDFIVEAVPTSGVRTRTIYENISTTKLLVRRAPQLSDTDRYKIALRALRMIGSQYSLFSIIGWGLAKVTGIISDERLPRVRSTIICSNVFFYAYAEITRNFLAGCPIDNRVLPAHLSATPDLEDVEVGWLTLI